MTQLQPIGTRLVVIPDPKPQEKGGIALVTAFTMTCKACKGKGAQWNVQFLCVQECPRCGGSGTYVCKPPITRKNFRATVVAVGEGKWSKKKGTVRAMPMKPGDRVFVTFWATRTASGSRQFDRERYGLPEGSMVVDLAECVALDESAASSRP